MVEDGAGNELASFMTGTGDVAVVTNNSVVGFVSWIQPEPWRWETWVPPAALGSSPEASSGIGPVVRFTTGSSTNGYDLSAVRLMLWADEGVSVKVSIFDHTGPPSTWGSQNSLAVLDNPLNVRDNPGSVKTFTAPSPVSLAASTTYSRGGRARRRRGPFQDPVGVF